MNTESTAPLLHSINEACRRLDVGRTLLYALIRDGEIKPIKIGARTKIPDSELQKLIAKRLREAA